MLPSSRTSAGKAPALSRGYTLSKAGHARALRADMRALPMRGDPDSPIHPRGRWHDPETGKTRQGDAACAADRDLILYAAAIGRKHGDLPDDLTGWGAIASGRVQGKALVTFSSGPVEIPISVDWLDFEPGPAAIEGPVIEATAEHCPDTAEMLLAAKPSDPPALEADQGRGIASLTPKGGKVPAERVKKAPTPRFKPKTITIIGRRGCRSFEVNF